MSAQPLIIGHRGASAFAPENTVAAFIRALRDGADGIEFDVRLASDGVPVVIHDATLRRTALMKGAVSDFPSSQLKKIDVGSWFNRAHPEIVSAKSAETIPTLAQVLDLLSDTRALAYLEMKADGDESERLAVEVLKLIRKHSLVDQIIVASFNLSSIQIVKRLDAHVRTAALFEPRLKRPISLLKRIKLLDLAAGSGADEIALHHSLISPSVVRQAERHGLPIAVWTVDDPKWIRSARRFRLKALITNDPARMRHALSAGADLRKN